MPKKLFIEMRVFGGGYGEGILISVCGELFFCIDSCSFNAAPRSKNTSFSYVNRIRGIEEAGLAVMMLSHPHADHFQGMDKFLTEYGDMAQKVAIFQGVTQVELENLHRNARKLAERSMSNYGIYKSFGKLLDAYREINRSKRYDVNDTSLLWEQRIVDDDGNSADLRVSALAPSQMNCDLFFNQVRGEDLFSTGRKKSSSQSPNLVSTILRFDFGSTRFILGGDAEIPAWYQVLEKFPSAQLKCNVLKVSHHGSSNANTEDILQAISKGKGTDEDTRAIIAPSFRYKLPEPRVVDLLERFFDEVQFTCALRADVAVTSGVAAKIPNLRDIRQLPKAARSECYVRFNERGQCVNAG